jgi:sigma-B regulation protein RsbU (phosphoserine phosphatase)
MHTKNDAQRALLAHLRHELRTPINAIIGYSEMLLEDLEAEATSLFANELKTIQACGKQLLSQVNSFLSSTALESASLELDIHRLSVTVRLEMSASVQSVIDCCDRLLQQEVTEIISDVFKIHGAAHSLLAMVSDLVTLSEQPLPFSDSQETNISELVPGNVTANPSWLDNSEKPPDSQGHILVADDNPTNRDLLSLQIEQLGYTVATAADGRQAIEMISTGQFDLILLDIIMPKTNGYQVLKWLHDSPWRYIPAIAISALDEIDSAVKCIEMGAEDYLPKPFNPVLLKARIGACLEKKRLRDREMLYLAQLAQANQEIMTLNERLKAENLRLSAELDVTRRLQQMILPKERELSQIQGIEIAGFMEPAEEVGGDYYDVIQHDDRVKIGIGDVTGHGLESGVLTIMVQTAIRTLIENNETDSKKFLEVLNRTIYKNVQRMNSDKNMTLSLLDYVDGKVSLSGQHEEAIVVRSSGSVERIDTIDLGFPLGLEENIADFVTQTQIQLNAGDVMVLYTDGITEAENELGEQYGLEKLCEVIRQNRQKSADEIRQNVIDNLRQHIGKHKIYDDITLVLLKQK